MYVRVVRFTDVTAERVEGLLAQIEESEGPPPGVPAIGLQVPVRRGSGNSRGAPASSTPPRTCASAERPSRRWIPQRHRDPCLRRHVRGEARAASVGLAAAAGGVVAPASRQKAEVRPAARRYFGGTGTTVATAWMVPPSAGKSAVHVIDSPRPVLRPPVSSSRTTGSLPSSGTKVWRRLVSNQCRPTIQDVGPAGWITATWPSPSHVASKASGRWPFGVAAPAEAGIRAAETASTADVAARRLTVT